MSDNSQLTSRQRAEIEARDNPIAYRAIRNDLIDRIQIRLDEEYHRIIDDQDLRLFRRILSELREEK